MKELTYELENFNIDYFLKQYEKDFKHIFYSLENEPIESLIDIFSVDDLSVQVNSLGKKAMEVLEEESQGIFLLLGAVADEEVRYYRFIDGVQYRISLGEVYEASAERFHDFETREDLINIGNINFNVESSLGLAINKKGNKLFINFAEINEDGFLGYIYDIGHMENLVLKYLSKFKY